MPVEWVLQKLTIGGIRSVLRIQITNWMLVGIRGTVLKKPRFRPTQLELIGIL